MFSQSVLGILVGGNPLISVLGIVFFCGNPVMLPLLCLFFLDDQQSAQFIH